MFILRTCSPMEPLSITVSSGAFFNEIKEAITYDKSIPLIYTQKTITEESNFSNNLLEVEKYCKNKNTTYCHILKQCSSLLNTLNSNIDKNKKNMEKLEEISNNKIKNYRTRRGIQFIGDFYNFCCNIATEKQIKHFYTNEEKLREQADRLRDVFVSDHKDLNTITTQLNNYTTITAGKLEILKKSLEQFYEEERDNGLLENAKIDKEIKGVQEIIFYVITMLIKFINYERESSTHLHCKIGKIPPRLINVNILYDDLQKLTKILKKDGYELAISTDDISSYYNIPITECQFSNTEILVKIKIPIREIKTNWKLFQYIPAHFKSNNSTCIIYSEKTYVAVNKINNEHRIISGIGLQHCDPPVTDLCYIPKFSSDISLTPKCVESIFKNSPLNEINKYCYFQCVTQDENDDTIIKQIGIHTFTVTNPQPTLFIRNGIGENTEIQELKINYEHPGLIKVKLPCDHELLQNKKVIIPKMYPCELINTNTLTIQRVLPISWTTLKSLKIIHEEQKDKMFFTNLTEILNHDWKKNVPNFHINKQIKDPEEYFKEIVLEKMPQRLINDLLGDIIYITWLSILTIIILFIIYKIYPIIIAVQLMMTAHQLPPPIPPR